MKHAQLAIAKSGNMDTKDGAVGESPVQLVFHFSDKCMKTKADVFLCGTVGFEPRGSLPGYGDFSKFSVWERNLE